MHFGNKNPQFDYTIFNKYGTEPLEKTKLEKDWVVFLQNNLKQGGHVSSFSDRANGILRMSEKNFKFLNKNVFKLLYTSFVRSPEYGVSVWNSYLKKDKRKLEKVQRRALKLITDSNILSIRKDCVKLNLCHKIPEEEQAIKYKFLKLLIIEKL